MTWKWRRFWVVFLVFTAIHVFLMHVRAQQRGTPADVGSLPAKLTYAAGGAALWNVLLGMLG